MKFGLAAAIARADGLKLDPAISPLISLVLLVNGQSAAVKSSRSTAQISPTEPIVDVLDEKVAFLEKENEAKSQEINALESEIENLDGFVEEQKSRNRYQQMANLNLAEKLYAKENEKERISSLENQLIERTNVENQMFSLLDMMRREIRELRARIRMHILPRPK